MTEKLPLPGVCKRRAHPNHKKFPLLLWILLLLSILELLLALPSLNCYSSERWHWLICAPEKMQKLSGRRYITAATGHLTTSCRNLSEHRIPAKETQVSLPATDLAATRNPWNNSPHKMEKSCLKAKPPHPTVVSRKLQKDHNNAWTSVKRKAYWEDNATQGEETEIEAFIGH